MKKYVFYFLVLFVFTLPWQAFIVIPGIGTISRLLGFSVIGIAVVYIIIVKKVKEIPLLFIIAMFFIMWGLISYAWTINQSATLFRFIQNIQLLAMFWLIWELAHDRNDYRILMQALIFGLFVSVFDMLTVYLGQTHAIVRFTASGFNPNRIGAITGRQSCDICKEKTH